MGDVTDMFIYAVSYLRSQPDWTSLALLVILPLALVLLGTWTTRRREKRRRAEQLHDVEPSAPSGGPAPTPVAAMGESPPNSSRPPGTATWRVSGYDLRRHAFLKIGETFSEAVCSHSVPTDRLVDLPAGQCPACQLILGDMLADQHGERDRYQP